MVIGARTACPHVFHNTLIVVTANVMECWQDASIEEASPDRVQLLVMCTIIYKRLPLSKLDSITSFQRIFRRLVTRSTSPSHAVLVLQSAPPGRLQSGVGKRRRNCTVQTKPLNVPFDKVRMRAKSSASHLVPPGPLKQTTGRSKMRVQGLPLLQPPTTLVLSESVRG